MPKVKADIPVLMEVAQHVYKGNVKNLNIKRYKTGRNAGELFVEYSLHDNKPFHLLDIEMRQKIAALIRNGATAMSQGNLKDLFVSKLSPTSEQYAFRLEVGAEQ